MLGVTDPMLTGIMPRLAEVPGIAFTVLDGTRPWVERVLRQTAS